MLQFKLYDRQGNELQFGDMVAISDGKAFTFYCRVSYIPEKQIIAPFHIFSFHSFVKVEHLPENAVRSSDPDYEIWYVPGDNQDEDKSANEFNDYLMSWRNCEIMMENRCYRIIQIEDHD